MSPYDVCVISAGPAAWGRDYLHIWLHVHVDAIYTRCYNTMHVCMIVPMHTPRSCKEKFGSHQLIRRSPIRPEIGEM